MAYGLVTQSGRVSEHMFTLNQPQLGEVVWHALADDRSIDKTSDERYLEKFLFSECGKRAESKLVTLGGRPRRGRVPDETRIHPNQYRYDIKTLKASNAVTRPFANGEPI